MDTETSRRTNQALQLRNLKWVSNDLYSYRAEAGESLFEEVSLDRVHSLDHNVEPDVELLAGNEEWVLHVPLH